MKAIVNQDTCIGCGLCISTVPEVFEVNADGKAEAYGHTTEQNKSAVQEAETDELINKIYDGSADKLFAALLGRKKLSAEQLERLRQIVGELE